MSRPFIFIPLTDVREVISRKKLLGLHVNVTSVARTLKVNRRTLGGHLEPQQELCAKLGIERSSGWSWKTPEIHRNYELAVRAIKENGGLPSPASLVEHTELSRGHVLRYLTRYPELAKRLGVVKDDVARVWYEGHVMIAAGVPVTRLGLAERAQVSYTRLNVILKANRSFVRTLQIARAPYASGVRKKLYN